MYRSRSLDLLIVVIIVILGFPVGELFLLSFTHNRLSFF